MAHRIEKVNETIKNTIGQAILEKIGLANGLISVTKVSASSDIKSARVFVSCFNSQDSAKVIRQLNSQAGYYQGVLRDHVQMRYTPKLKFILDDSIEYADKIEKLLKE